MTSIAKNDKIVDNMISEMYRIKKNQLKKFKILNESKSQNKLLGDVIEDYKSYHDIIKKQKQQQYNTLDKISDYIDSVSQDLNKTDNILKKTNEDQKEILEEMNKIKREIDELVF
jgi:chromosome segregation ATPase|tara:strand:- start:28 stop:372 length:345 start_codon:yes stop_codon:yes gene_type:complete